MKIISMRVEGFRSYKSPVAFHFEPTVTVVLGANDHGKSNLLLAIKAINDDEQFNEEDDLSWDLPGHAEQFPLITYDLEFDDAERKLVATHENSYRKSVRYTNAQGAPVVIQSRQVGTPPKATNVYVLESTNEILPSTAVRKVETLKEGEVEATPEDVPKRFQLTLRGCDKVRTVTGLDDWREEAYGKVLKSWIPRVELIAPWTDVADSVTWDQIENEENEFMRGIMYYAGLTPDKSKHLFHQSDSTLMELAIASQKLNATLKESWSQGSNLDFMLQHNSKNAAIELLIKDPAVSRRYVRASRRSSGFTHYFTLKTILYARQQEHTSNSRVIMFDEPGIYLHPSGQMDLLRVLRDIGTENQVVYVTHSLFMIDKNFPSAHRLLVKEKDGTAMEGKPYVGGWGRAMSSLGITLAGSILFANHVLLTEGDSDPIYLYATLAKLNELNRADIDLNALAIISTGDGKNADALIRMLTESRLKPQLAYLLDGDTGGSDRARELSKVCDVHNVMVDKLSRNSAVEDHVIGSRKLLPVAAANYAVKLRKDRTGEEVKAEDLQAKLEVSIENRGDLGKVSGGLITILTKEVAALAGLKSDASKVGIAREYTAILHADNTKLDKRDFDRASKLAEKIQSLLKVPRRTTVDKSIDQSDA